MARVFFTLLYGTDELGGLRPQHRIAERSAKSKGQRSEAAAGVALNKASELHGVGRLSSGFDLMEVVSEYRALRASVLELWHQSKPQPDERDVSDITRFNESIDQSLAEAVMSYTHRIDQSRDLFLAWRSSQGLRFRSRRMAPTSRNRQPTL